MTSHDTSFQSELVYCPKCRTEFDAISTDVATYFCCKCQEKKPKVDILKLMDEAIRHTTQTSRNSFDN